MQRSTSCCIWWCQKDRIITIQQLTLVLGRRAKRGRSLSSLSATSNCEPHDFIRLRASATVGLESREADGCPSFLEKRDRRELSFLREPLTMHANRPLKDIACVLHAQTKDATVVCVIGCQITRTRIHTLPKRLASARHSRVRKLYSYQIHSARFKQTSQWRRKSWWCILPAALILWHAGSDVMGCRRPTGGVFSYVSSDRVTLRAFPVATPRGRSSSSHGGEQPVIWEISITSQTVLRFEKTPKSAIKYQSSRYKLWAMLSTLILQSVLQTNFRNKMTVRQLCPLSYKRATSEQYSIGFITYMTYTF